MKSYYDKVGERIILPWGGVNKMAKKLKIGSKALSKVLDGQKSSKWQFEYSFEEIRKIALENYNGHFG